MTYDIYTKIQGCATPGPDFLDISLFQGLTKIGQGSWPTYRLTGDRGKGHAQQTASHTASLGLV